MDSEKDLFDEISFALNGRPISAVIWILSIILGLQGILLPDIREGVFLSPITRPVLFLDALAICVMVCLSIWILIKKKTRTWLLSKDQEFGKVPVSFQSKCIVRGMPILISAIVWASWYFR
jgi:hypothetical protein